MTKTRSDSKSTDVEQELLQYKEENEERIKKLEGTMDAMRAESEKRHAELMNLMLQQARNTAPSPPPPSTVTPPLITAAIPTPNIGFSTSFPPIFQSSNLGFDEQGYPMPTYSENHSNNRGSPLPFRTQGITPPMSSGTFSFGPFGHFGVPSFSHEHGRGSGPTGERTWVPGSDHRLRKLKMSLFDGEDAYGWVYRIERFFDIQGFTTTGERLRATVLCMEGQALSWYRWSDGRHPFRHWEDLKDRILDRFQPSQEGDLYEQFLAIKQEGSAREYIGTFETLAAQLDGIPEKVMEGTFIKGLKQELRTSVRLLQPTGLNQAIRLALMVDESRSGSNVDIGKGGVKGPTTKTGGNGSRLNTGPAIGGPRPAVGGMKPTFKRMTDAEYADKRAKGLCFRCDGKFGPGHRCPEKTLQVLIVPSDDEDEGETQEETEGHVHLDAVEVSSQSVVGLTAPHTMKLRGYICGVEVVVLIDSGATHNFVSLKLVEPLQLEVSGNRETGVVLGNGKAAKSYGICRQMELRLPGLIVTEDFFPLELGSTDVILGIKWLRRLGDTR